MADRRRTVPVLAAVTVLGLAACGEAGGAEDAPAALPTGDASVELDAADFTVDITNEYWPMRPGDRWVYEATEDGGPAERIEVTVLDETYTVAAGIEARVVHDVATLDGVVLEDTFDWYAQDADGNIWYFGEATTSYSPGEPPTTEGSWEAGVDGAQPGVAVPAEPRAGLAYRQEYLEGEAEDTVEVLSTDEQVETPTGAYTGALLTRDTSPLDPDVAELKFYVPGVGQVLTLQTAGGSERAELVEVGD